MVSLPLEVQATDSEGELRPRGRPRSMELRRRVLGAAVALCAEVGPIRSTLEEIASRSGVSRASIYRNWPDRTTLLEEALKDSFNQLVVRPPYSEDDPQSVLTSCYLVVSAITSHDVGRAMMRIVMEPIDPEVADRLTRPFYQLVHSPYVAALERCQTRGLLRTDLSVETLCWIGISQGLFHVAVLHASFSSESAVKLAETVALGVKCRPRRNEDPSEPMTS